jgi:hypothetical protein
MNFTANGKQNRRLLINEVVAGFDKYRSPHLSHSLYTKMSRHTIAGWRYQSVTKKGINF